MLVARVACLDFIMNEFSHIRIIIGFIVSLSIAQLLRGVAKLLVHPTQKKPYWVHLLWVAYLFLNLVYFWWWEYRLSQLTTWVFSTYLLVILYIVVYYLCCYLLFPDDIGEYKTYKDFYFSRLHWFFGVLCLTLLIDIIDTFLKGKAYAESLGSSYLIRIGIHFTLCLIAIKVKDERYHAALALLSLLFTVVWISQQYLIA